MTSDGKPRIVVERDGAIATVALSNPGKLNALTVSMWQELARVMGTLSVDDALRCIVLRGAGSEAFAAGADIAVRAPGGNAKVLLVQLLKLQVDFRRENAFMAQRREGEMETAETGKQVNEPQGLYSSLSEGVATSCGAAQPALALGMKNAGPMQCKVSHLSRRCRSTGYDRAVPGRALSCP